MLIDSPDQRVTRLLPAVAEAATTTARQHSTGLPGDLLSQSARRLQILALLYSFTFFMSAFGGNMLSASARAQMLAEYAYWIPDLAAIAAGLAVAAAMSSHHVSPAAAVNIGLGFMIVSSYGIAVAEYLNPARLDQTGGVGLSWVAVWTLLFTVMAPARPRLALLATLLSLSSVPVVIGLMVVTGATTFRPTLEQYFGWHILPYLLVAVLAYVCQRVVYALGKEVTRARELGSYRLVARLGQGGMGEVWRAHHHLLARPAAIKLLRPPVDTDPRSEAWASTLRRFEREAQVTAQMRSPHTVELWDFGVADDGSFYYVMELLDGLDLETLVKRHGPLPAERVVHLLRQVCHSLGEAEASGLVHRDIKPANIFVCRYGTDFDFVKVLDFGIVKAVGPAAADPGILATRANVLQGTPAFIAPEQALGGDVDGRADIYATGCVAYWLLTGQLLFTADSIMGLLLHHARSIPLPPSARSEVHIPEALDRLVMTCLAKDPDQRPQTARELSQRLAGIAGLPEWSEQQARDWWMQHEPAA